MRKYKAGFFGREAAPWQGAHLELTTSPSYISPGGGVSLSGKEDGRDGGATRYGDDDATCRPPPEKPARRVWNNFRARGPPV
jgi:hypothetical protein